MNSKSLFNTVAYKLYKRLKKIARSLARRVVFITGDVMTESTRAFLLDSGSPYFTKPVDIELLLREINNIVLNSNQV